MTIYCAKKLRHCRTQDLPSVDVRESMQKEACQSRSRFFLQSRKFRSRQSHTVVQLDEERSRVLGFFCVLLLHAQRVTSIFPVWRWHPHFVGKSQLQGPVLSCRELYFLLNMGGIHTFDPAVYKSFARTVFWHMARLAPVYLATWFSFLKYDRY